MGVLIKFVSAFAGGLSFLSVASMPWRTNILEPFALGSGCASNEVENGFEDFIGYEPSLTQTRQESHSLPSGPEVSQQSFRQHVTTAFSQFASVDDFVFLGIKGLAATFWGVKRNPFQFFACPCRHGLRPLEASVCLIL